MRQGQYELEVIVNAKPVYEYPFQGDTYIEGRKNSTFKLRFKNTSGNNVLVVPSVDGISTLDGNPAGPDSPGIIVKANSHVEIPGWMVNTDQSSEFLFQDREASYARSIDRTTTNTGVIGLLVFGEAEKARQVTNIVNYPSIYPVIQPWTPWTTPKNPYGADPIWVSNTSSNPTYSINTSSVTLGMDNMLVGSTAGTLSQNSVEPVKSAERRITKDTPENIGVGWGQAVEFKMNTTTFDKGEKLAQLVLFYDTRKNLERRGIIVEKRDSISIRPNPFPGMGCKPPAGWKG